MEYIEGICDIFDKCEECPNYDACMYNVLGPKTETDEDNEDE